MLNHQPLETRYDSSTSGEASDDFGSVRPQINWVELFCRYRFFLMLGLAIGLAGGYYHFIQSPAAFVSSAKVQLIEPSTKNLPVQGIDAGRSNRSYADEALVMRGESILRRAAEVSQLAKTPGFFGWNVESIAGSLASSRELIVGLANKNPQTSVFEISYQSGDPLTSQRVVQGILDAYGEHLQSQYQNIGNETLNLIKTAKDEVLSRLEKKESEFDQFKQSSQLVIHDGKAMSVHRENAHSLLTAKQSLLVRKTSLESMLRAAENAIAADEPLQAVLLALSGPLSGDQSINGTVSITDKMTSEMVRKFEKEAELTQSERMRESRLLPLAAEAEQLMLQFGAGHPAVKSVQSQITVIQNNIERLQVSEKEYARKMEQLLANQDAKPESTVDPLDDVRRSVNFKLLAVKQQLFSVEREFSIISEAYDSEINAAKSESVSEMTVEKFTREISRQQVLYDKIVARLDEINVLSQDSSLRVFPLESAKAGFQIAPNLSKSLMMGGVLGLLLACAFAYLREVSDKSYRSAEQVSEHLGIPVIGHVPVFKAETKLAKEWGHGIDPHLVSFYRPKSTSAEVFKAIRTALYFSNRSGDFKVLQVTSPTPGDGKSTVAANLAITMAQSGKSVLLVDSDLRRPRVQKLFGIESKKGVAWLLEQLPKAPSPEQVKDLLGEVIVESPIDNLSIMGAGHRPDNPSELLSSTQFDCLSNVLRGLFDVVIIDSPPLLAVTDPSTLASRVDGVIMVVKLRKNVKPLAARASRMLETLEANVIGVVINGVGSRSAKGYGKYADTDGYFNSGKYYQYGYGYSYGSDSSGTYDEYYSEDDGVKKKKEILSS